MSRTPNYETVSRTWLYFLIALFIVVVVTSSVIIAMNTRQMKEISEVQECMVRLTLEPAGEREDLVVEGVLEACPDHLRDNIERQVD